jgi:dTDP-4-amino-4,6-dideoxygalactose transaminase
MMTAYKNLGFDIADYPNAFAQYENEVTLPLHTRLTDEDVEYVISNFVDIIKSL